MKPDYSSVISSLNSLMASCTLCPHRCGVNRLAEKVGRCKTGTTVKVASHNIHHGEEPPISGTRGSGTIFFAHCTLSCLFCQNYPISQLGHGTPATNEDLAGMMLSLQERGAHNINFVTPSHVISNIVQAVSIARTKGLTLPLVYNCSGYESVEVLRLLDGIIDIYLPDAKYSSSSMATQYSNAPDYWDINRRALIEMYRQVGNLQCDEQGIATRGLIIRHLVLPGNIAGSTDVLQFIAETLSPETRVSIMSQYHTAYRSDTIPELSRKVSPQEYESVIATAESLGMEHCWIQELE